MDKDVEKAIELGGKIAEMEEVLKKLKSKESVIQTEFERKQREIDSYSKDVIKKIEQDKEKANIELSAKKQALDEREKEINRKEKQIAKREEELEIIHEQAKALSKQQEATSLERKEIDAIKANLLDKENLLKLKISQYDAKLKELETITKN